MRTVQQDQAVMNLITAGQRLVQLLHALEHFGQVVVSQAASHILWPVGQAAVICILCKGLKGFIIPAQALAVDTG